MLSILNKISSIKDLVIVGSFGLQLRGFKVTANDIDLVVTNLEDLRSLGTIIEINSISNFSYSNKRAYIKIGSVVLDIFIEKELPSFDLIGNIKVQSINELEKHYNHVIKNYNNDTIKLIFKEKLKTLRNEYTRNTIDSICR